MFLLDLEGRITSWNAGAERITGYAAHEVLGREFGLFFTREDRERGVPQQHLLQARELGRCEDEGWRVRREGSSYWSSTTLSALRGRDGRLLGFAKVTRDESERKHIETLEEGRRQIDEFLAMLGHELRNPLAPIANAVQLLQAVHTSDDRVMYARDVIERQATHLTRLVEDLLDVSRITSGKITLRREVVDAPRPRPARSRGRPPAGGGAEAGADRGGAARAAARRRRPGAPLAGTAQPGEQRRQVHAARRAHRAAGA